MSEKKRVVVYGFMPREGLWERLKALFRPKPKDFSFSLILVEDLVLIDVVDGAASIQASVSE